MSDTQLTKNDLLEVMEPFMASIADEFSSLHEDITEIKTDVKQLKTDVVQLKADVSNLKVDVGQIKTDVKELQVEMKEVKFEVGYLKNNMVTKSYLDDKMADLASDINISRSQEVKMIKLLIEFLTKNKVLTSEQTKELFSIAPAFGVNKFGIDKL